MLLRFSLSLTILLLVVAPAEAQFIAAGSTPQGDYLRGVGIAAMGMGQYNLNTAQANQINTQTSMMLNEYIYQSYKNLMKENAEYRRAMIARNSENYRKLHEKIHDNPDSLDVTRGDALNSVLNDILSPAVSDSAARYVKIPLDADIVRRIPFKLGAKGEKFSMGRLLLKGPKRWAVAFQGPEFGAFRETYQRAVDNALELAMDGKQGMAEQAIKDIMKAVEDLERKFRQTPAVRDPEWQREYVEAKEQLDKLRTSPRLFMTKDLQPIFQEIDSYAGTTVYDLIAFMRKHGLTFAPAETFDERAIYPQLYTALKEQQRKSTGAE